MEENGGGCDALPFYRARRRLLILLRKRFTIATKFTPSTSLLLIMEHATLSRIKLLSNLQPLRYLPRGVLVIRSLFLHVAGSSGSGGLWSLRS